MDGPDVSVLLHGPESCSGIFCNLCRGIFRNLCRGILNGLYGPDLCLRIFLGCPSLELPKQGFSVHRPGGPTPIGKPSL